MDKNNFRGIRSNLSLFLTFFSCLILIATTGHSLSAKPLPLPDRIVLKQTAPLPPTLTDRNISCLITEETPQSVTISTSVFKGITEKIIIPRENILELTKGKPGIREYALIEELLLLPEDSQPTEYYHEIISLHLNPFLKKFPDHEQHKKVQAAAASLQRELDLIKSDHIKAKGNWYTFEEFELILPDLLAQQTLNALEIAGKRGDVVSFLHQLAMVKKHRDSQLYPDLIVAASKWGTSVLDDMQIEGYLLKLQQEKVWLKGIITQLSVVSNLIKNQDAARYMNPQTGKNDFFYDPKTRFWHRATESQMDASTGKVVQIISATEESRLEEIKNEIADINSRIGELNRAEENLNDSFLSQQKTISKHLEKFSEIDTAALRKIIILIEQYTTATEQQSLTLDKAGQAITDTDSIIENISSHCKWLVLTEAELDRHLAVWPELLTAVQLKESFTSITPMRIALEKRHWKSFDSPVPEDTSLTAKRWIQNRKTDMARLLERVTAMLPDCLAQLEKGEILEFQETARQILMITPSGPQAQKIQRASIDYFNTLLDQGDRSGAIAFHQMILSLPGDKSWAAEWGAEFSWVNLWGLRRYINRPSTLLLFGIAAVAFISILVIALTIYIFLRKRILKLIFRRSW